MVVTIQEMIDAINAASRADTDALAQVFKDKQLLLQETKANTAKQESDKR